MVATKAAVGGGANSTRLKPQWRQLKAWHAQTVILSTAARKFVTTLSVILSEVAGRV